MSNVYLRRALAAVQPYFSGGDVLQIEITQDDVCVYIRENKRMSRKRVDTGLGFEADLLEATELIKSPQQG